MNNLHSNINKHLYAAALIISCCFVCGCENDPVAIQNQFGRKVEAEEAWKVVSYMSQEGKMKAKLTAPYMYRVSGGSDTIFVEFPRSLHVDFYNDSTRIESWVDAKYGKYYEVLNKVYLRDSVVVISITGDTLRCHDLWWDQNRQIFYTDNIAYYNSPANQVTGGKGMEATQDLKTVTFKYPNALMNMTDAGMGQ